ncbi:hypothetical protein [Bosea sp. 117]|uniref:hypothetical protein n=1 Tax=Bosea sp. 117 TaxID=1125973 RepID=UPI000B29EF5F|nr:hypothetical protein [Bosea sp. 117]
MPHGSDSRRQTADYIAEMAQELARIAAQHDFQVLQHLLQMAWEEARSIAHADTKRAEG